MNRECCSVFCLDSVYMAQQQKDNYLIQGFPELLDNHLATRQPRNEGSERRRRQPSRNSQVLEILLINGR